MGRVAQPVLRLNTGWTVRGSNPGEARFSAVQTGLGGSLSLLYKWVPGLPRG